MCFFENSVMKIVSFNLRHPMVGNTQNKDGVNGLISRIGMIYEKINQELPDVIAFQEMKSETADIFRKMFPDYLFVGHGREENLDGEGVFTAIRKETTDLIGLSTFWIAPRQYDCHSRYSDQSRHPRMCTMTTLFHKESKTSYRVFNVHLDNEGEIARREGIRCVLENAMQENEKVYMPLVILGDFNETPGGTVVEGLNGSQIPRLYDITESVSGTYHGFGKMAQQSKADKKIDYIFVSKEFKKRFKKVELWKDTQNGLYLSDHYPICATFKL